MVGEQPKISHRILTIPNFLSFVRLLLVPVFGVLIVLERDGPAVLVLMVSGFTDYLDGTLARRWGQITRIGQLLDPAADRLYILTTLIGLAYRDVIPWWLVVVLIARDVLLAVTLLGLLTPAERAPLEVHFLGKAGTACLLYAFPLVLLGNFDGAVGTVAQPIGWGFALWGTCLYWYAGLIYLRQVAAVRARRRITFAADESGTVA